MQKEVIDMVTGDTLGGDLTFEEFRSMLNKPTYVSEKPWTPLDLRLLAFRGTIMKGNY